MPNQFSSEVALFHQTRKARSSGELMNSGAPRKKTPRKGL